MARGKKTEDAPLPAEQALDELLTQQELEAAPADEDLYVVREIRIPNDPFNIIRRRVKLTPATCPDCALDLVEKNAARLGGPTATYETLPPAVQETLRAALAEHRRVQHSSAEAKVVRGSELSRSWLGRA